MSRDRFLRPEHRGNPQEAGQDPQSGEGNRQARLGRTRRPSMGSYSHPRRRSQALSTGGASIPDRGMACWAPLARSAREALLPHAPARERRANGAGASVAASRPASQRMLSLPPPAPRLGTAPAQRIHRGDISFRHDLAGEGRHDHHHEREPLLSRHHRAARRARPLLEATLVDVAAGLPLRGGLPDPRRARRWSSRC